MHDNEVYYAILNELYRQFPNDKATEEGRKKLEQLVIDIMTAIRDKGIHYVNARGE